MRRGLIRWSRAELPEAALAGRIARARAGLASAGADALAVYTNLSRAAGVSWFTGFVPFWSEALLLVPRQGTTTLYATMSKRSMGWIEQSSHIDRVVPSQRVGVDAGKALSEAKRGAVLAVAGLDALPAGIAEDLRAADGNPVLVEGGGLVEGARAVADPAEIALAGKAGAIARRALAAVSPDHAEAAAAVAAIEGAARRLGAEEVYIAVAPELDRDRRLRRVEGRVSLASRFAVRATVAYKGVWIRMVRTVARDGAGPAGPDAAEAVERLAGAAAGLPETGGFAGMARWLVEGCRIDNPLEPLLGSDVAEPRQPAAGALVSVQAALDVGGRLWLVGAPALVGSFATPGSLLVQPEFDDAA